VTKIPVGSVLAGDGSGVGRRRSSVASSFLFIKRTRPARTIVPENEEDISLGTLPRMWIDS